jgi:uncharacterized alkaline shock family protein YloU
MQAQIAMLGRPVEVRGADQVRQVGVLALDGARGEDGRVGGRVEADGIGAGATIAGFAGRLTRADQRSSGVSVEVGQREAAVDLNMTVEYGVSIPQGAEAVRQNVMDRVYAMTGLTVKEVNSNAADLYFPEEQTPARVQ